jgi:hypothetical protein
MPQRLAAQRRWGFQAAPVWRHPSSLDPWNTFGSILFKDFTQLVLLLQGTASRECPKLCFGLLFWPAPAKSEAKWRLGVQCRTCRLPTPTMRLDSESPWLMTLFICKDTKGQLLTGFRSLHPPCLPLRQLPLLLICMNFAAEHPPAKPFTSC